MEKAKKYLQNKYPQMRGVLWNSNPNINDDWIATVMEEYATQYQEDMKEYIFEVARQFHRLGKYYGSTSDTHFTDIYEETIKAINKQTNGK